LDLPFEDYATIHGRLDLEKRRLQPDAILEVPALKKRFFIEYETGSATVRDAKKSTSTMAKLDRYAIFLGAPAGDVLRGERRTAYERAFADAWPPEVLFVTRTEARRDLIGAVIREREKTDKYEAPARAMTLTEAQRFLCRTLYGADRHPGTVQCSIAAAAPAPASTGFASVPEGPAENAAHERLRRGRVSVRGEQLIKFEKTLRTSLSTLESAQGALARLNVPSDAIPKVPSSTAEILRVLSEYARRAQDALARYGLIEAD
jgi:hypothetical protein